MVNTNPQSFKDVKVFVGGPFNAATRLYYKNLYYTVNNTRHDLNGVGSAKRLCAEASEARFNPEDGPSMELGQPLCDDIQ